MSARTVSPSCAGSNFIGSAVASSTNGQPLVGQANEANDSGESRKKSYSSFQGGSHLAYGPLVYHNYTLGGYNWDGGIVVQNLAPDQATVDLYYYDTDGNLAASQLDQSIASQANQVFFCPQNEFVGSVTILADQDIAAVVYITNSAATGDTHAVYNASSR
jgi:hypothetical protein